MMVRFTRVNEVGLAALVAVAALGCSGDEADPSLGQGLNAGAPAGPVQGPQVVTPTPNMVPTPTINQPAVPPAINNPPAQPQPAMPGPIDDGSMDTPAEPAMPVDTEPGEPELAMDECGLDTGYLGDEYCILPPPEDKGFQVHIGPADYKNPGRDYLLMPGEEITRSYTFQLHNPKPIHFYYRQYRQRPTAHHNIITAGGGAGGVDVGHRIGTTNHWAEDAPVGGVPAPENVGLGIPIAANATINVNLHANNFTDKPELREVWINFWYVPEDEVTQEAQALFAVGDPTFAIAPGQTTTLGPYSCTVEGDGRLLWFYGHRHASNTSFKTWRVRGSQRDLIYYGWDWEDPLVLDYSSIVDNPMPDPANMVEGGWSGPLDVKAGDRIEWECEVHNTQDTTLRFTNNTFSGEMCIMDGEFVGTNCRSGFAFPGL